MKINWLIITILSFFLVSCDQKKRNDDENLTKQEAVLSENLERNFILNLTDDSILSIQKKEDGFKISNKIPTIFTFITPWCPPCQAQNEILNDIFDKFGEKIQIIGVLNENFDKNQTINFKNEQNIKFDLSYGENNQFLIKILDEISGVPFTIFYDKNGKKIISYLGIVPEEMLINDIERTF